MKIVPDEGGELGRMQRELVEDVIDGNGGVLEVGGVVADDMRHGRRVPRKQVAQKYIGRAGNHTVWNKRLAREMPEIARDNDSGSRRDRGSDDVTVIWIGDEVVCDSRYGPGSPAAPGRRAPC